MVKEKKGLVYDRYSIVFILLILSAIWLVYIGVKTKDIQKAMIPISGSIVITLSVLLSSARIRRNEYDGVVHYKSEDDCGLSTIPLKRIDGLVIKRDVSQGIFEDKFFKAPGGTDITIDKKGNISYVGVGSKFISLIRDAGYRRCAPKI